jgi:CHAT domain-containing protein
MLDIRGDSARVLPEMRAALDTIAKVNGRDYPELGEWRTMVARAMENRGDIRGAIAQGLESERIRRTHFRLVVNALGEHDALNAPPRSESGWDRAARLAARAGTPAEQDALFDALVRSRAEWLDELAERRRAAGAAGAGDSAVAALARRFAERCSELSKRALAGAGDTPAAEFAAKLSALQARRDSAEQQLAAASPVYARNRSRRAIGAADAIAALPKGAALVSYVRAGDVYLAYVVAPGQARGAWVTIGEAARVDGLVSAWRATLRPGAAAAAGHAAGARLREAIWSPIVRPLKGAPEVYVVPDGELNRVPFAALPGGDGVPLAERGPLLRFLGCERDLVDEHELRRSSLRVVVGGPAFGVPVPGSPDSSRALHPAVVSTGIRFAPLPGAAAEAGEVAAVWRRGDAHEDVREFVGEAASEAAFREWAPRAGVLHVATHGFFLDERGESGSGQRGIGGLAPPEAQGSAAPRAVVYASPLVRSGLALAGANRLERSDGADDGVLTADEGHADLQSVDCAVLPPARRRRRDRRERGRAGAVARVPDRRAVAGVQPVAVDDAATREGWWRSTSPRPVLGRRLARGPRGHARGAPGAHRARRAGFAVLLGGVHRAGALKRGPARPSRVARRGALRQIWNRPTMPTSPSPACAESLAEASISSARVVSCSTDASMDFTAAWISLRSRAWSRLELRMPDICSRTCSTVARMRSRCSPDLRTSSAPSVTRSPVSRMSTRISVADSAQRCASVRTSSTCSRSM